MGLLLLLPLSRGLWASERLTRDGAAIDVISPVGQGTISSAFTYALNQALTQVASSAIDLSATCGLYINVTSAAQSALIGVEFSHVTYAAFVRAYELTTDGSRFVGKINRYVRFRNIGTIPTATMSLAYSPASDCGTFALGGGATTIGTVNQGSPGTAAWPVSITTSPQVSQGAVGASVQNWFFAVTSPATATCTSPVVYTVSGPVLINVSSQAAVSGLANYGYDIDVSGTTSVGILWRETNSSTRPPDKAYGTLVPNGLTVRVEGIPPGTHLHLSPTSATDISATACVCARTVAVRQ